MSEYFTGGYTSGISLSLSFENPVAIAASGYITNTGTFHSGDAIYGYNILAWDITNLGRITAPGTAGSGVDLRAGGTVSNAAGAALIAGFRYGIVVRGAAGTVTNSGTIEATGTQGIGVSLLAGSIGNDSGALISGYVDGAVIVTGTGTLTNSGMIQATGAFGHGVYLLAGGSIDNTVGAEISAPFTGIVLRAPGGTVTNSGTIEGTGTQVNGDGIAAFGTATASITNASGALISGYDGILLSHITGTVGNSGTINGTGSLGQAAAVSLYPTVGGISVTNSAGAQMTGVSNGILLQGTAGGTVNNLGTITGTAEGIDVGAGSGMTVTNAAGALISGGGDGLVIFASAVSVDNFGTIQGMGTGASNAAIELDASGSAVTVTNEPGGLIAGSFNGVFIPLFVGASNVVTNLGTITGSGRGGIYIGAFGTVVNGGTSNTTALISDPQNGIFIETASGTVTNYGTVLATSASGDGINLQDGTVTNFGQVVAGSYGTGIYLRSGNVTNNGTIIAIGSSANAVVVRYGTFLNYGAVSGSVYGIEVSTTTTDSGTVNVAGTVIGATGIAVLPSTSAGQTVTVSGTVTGTAGTAASLGGGTNRLIVEPGAAFSGIVDGGNGASVLEIAALSGAGLSGSTRGLALGSVADVSLGSVANFSALQIDPSAALDSSGALSFDTVVNQGQINVDSGASLAFGTVADTGVIDLQTGGMIRFEGPVADQTLIFNPPGGIAAIDQPQEFGGTIAGFVSVQDTIDLTGLLGGTVGNGGSLSGDQLVISNGSDVVTLQLDVEDYTGITWVAGADGGGTGTDVTPACFSGGTLILTDRGEVAVEDLAIGDTVITLSGAARPIRWIARRAYNPRFVAGNRRVLPIRIEAGALAYGVPARDLWVSPEHALYIDGVLVPAHLLVNGATITQVASIERLEYFHIELDTHDVILADSAPAETFVDCDNRGVFHNSREFAALYPGARPPSWKFCAPRIEEGASELAAIRRTVLARAEVFGRFTHDSDFHLVVDGAIVRPQSVENRTLYRFRVPAGAGSVSLASRSAVPAQVGIAPADRRRLGIAVERIVLSGAGYSIDIGHASPTLSEGFHEPEGSHRWTDGEGQLPSGWLAAFAGALMLEVKLAETEMRYGLDGVLVRSEQPASDQGRAALPAAAPTRTRVAA